MIAAMLQGSRHRVFPFIIPDGHSDNATPRSGTCRSRRVQNLRASPARLASRRPVPARVSFLHYDDLSCINAWCDADGVGLGRVHAAWMVG
jgi:hypothetical protein